MVGPSIWGIEYPGVEALAAGVLQQRMAIPSLSVALVQLLTTRRLYGRHRRSKAFYAEHGGATAKHLAVLVPWLEGEVESPLRRFAPSPEGHTLWPGEPVPRVPWTERALAYASGVAQHHD
jgi:hypothetical protein